MNPGPKVVTHLFGKSYLPITDTLIVGWVSVILILILAKYLTSRLKIRPGKKQNIAEFVLNALI